MRSFNKTINIELYGCKLKFTVTDDITSEVSKLFKKNKINDVFDGGAEGIMISFEMDCYNLIIDEECLSHNTIAHEIYHVVVRITEDRNINDEESQAWLCGNITEVIYKFLESKKLKIKHGK
jgi:hypothetical protein